MILILTTEPLPLLGMVSTGAGLRAWQLYQGLRSAGFEDVQVRMPEELLVKLPPDQREGAREFCFPRPNLKGYLEEQKPTVLILQHWGLMQEFEPASEAGSELNCPVVIDLAGPHLLERYYWGEQEVAAVIEEKLRALRRADFLTTSGSFLRHYFLPFCLLAGFKDEKAWLPVIPISYAPEPPAVKKQNLLRFVYGGMFLPWQDPWFVLHWLSECLQLRGKGELHFYGGAHPRLDVSGGKFARLLDYLNKTPQVAVKSLLPFDALLKEYQQAGLAIELFPRNLERELAFTTRTIIYMWCGLPVIYNNYAELSVWIERYQAGWTLDPEDERGFKELIFYLFDHPQEIVERGKNAQRLVREQFSWDKTVGPLAEFCRTPAFRAEKTAEMLKWETQLLQQRRLERQLEAALKELNTLKGKKIFRLHKALTRGSPIIAALGFFLSLGISIISLLALLLTDLIGKFLPVGGGKKQGRHQ